MHTADRRAFRQALPSWGYETLRVMADIERGLRYAAHLQGMDPRVGDKLQLLRDAVGVMQVSLSACEHTTQQVFAEITEAPSQDRPSPSAKT